MKILNVVGARPNFMKIGPIIEAMTSRSRDGAAIEHLLVHTGQHYDRQLSALFFEQLGLPSPDVNLEVGSGSHAVQTAQIMTRFEAVCLEQKPSDVLVVGDVNSTVACALVAAKLQIRVVHVEAGLRSFDRTMPEEINRILTDAIADELFTTEQSANSNLRREGVPDAKVHFVGNVMIDTLMRHREKAQQSPILKDLGLAAGPQGARPYAVLTLHRPATVDDPARFREILEAMLEVSRRLPIVFPVHPRTRDRLEAFELGGELRWAESHAGSSDKNTRGIIATAPLGYLDFLCLVSSAQLVLTDSGGIQEETTILGVPCVTLRESTERPVTVERGTNVVAGTRKSQVLAHALAQLERPRTERLSYPPLWDGKAAERIVDVLIATARYQKGP
jgi:UDP-N-acetylglucosamine 2-epimerase (non-hydrolysing)